MTEGTTARRGPYAKSTLRRQEILDRTMAVCAERGITGTSMRAIGDEIGISHGALRHYFISREELLLAVLAEAEAQLGVDPYEHADAGPIPLMLFALRRNITTPGLVSLYTSMLAASLEPGNELSREFFTRRFTMARSVLVDLIRQGQRTGALRGDLSPESAAALIVAASDGLQEQWLLDPGIDIVSSLEILATALSTPTVAQPTR